MSMSDEVMLDRWLAGRDVEAFHAIVTQYARIVFGTARRILGNDMDAEDVTQECFEALADAPGHQTPLALGPWLHGVATRKSLMRLRAEGRRRERETRYAQEQPLHTDAAWDDLYDLVDEAIAELPEELRAPLVYHYLCGWSQGQIARVTGTPRRTVSNRIASGLGRVADFLRDRNVQTVAGGLGVVLAAGFAEASPAPASLTASLGRLVLGQAQTGVIHIPVAGGGVLAMLGKAMVLLTVIAVIGVLGGVGQHLYVAHKTPAIAEGTLAEPAGNATASSEPVNVSPGPVPEAPEMPPVNRDDSKGEQAAVTASAGATGEITGYVLDMTMTADMLAKLYEMRDDPASQQAGENILSRWRDVDVVMSGMGMRESVRTDESGGFAFRELPPGEYVLHVVPPPEVCPIFDAEPGKERKVFVDAGKTATVTFSIQAGLRISGQVVDSRSRGIAGAAIKAIPVKCVAMDQSYARIETEAAITGSTDEAGGYVLDRIAPASIRDAIRLVMMGEYSAGLVEVIASAKGYAPSRIFVHCVTQAMAADAKGFLERARKNGMLGNDDSPAPASVPLAACAGDMLTGLNLTLAPEARIAGVVRTSLGNVVPEAKLWVNFDEEEPPCKPAEEAQHEHPSREGAYVYFAGKPFQAYRVPPEPVTTDADGAFSVGGLSAGVYRFEVEWPDGRKQKARNAGLTLALGQQVASCEIVVEDPEERVDLAGVVVDAVSQQPVDECSVWLKSVASELEPAPQLGVLEQNGSEKARFQIKGVTPGVALLEIKAPRHATEQFEVDLRDPKERDRTYPLTREGVITGRVLLGGQPKDAQVTARHVDGWPEPYQGSDKETGKYTIGELKPGAYEVSTYINLEGPTDTQRVLQQHVEVEAGKTVEVNFDFDGLAVLRGGFTCAKEVRGAVRVYPGDLETTPDQDSPESINELVAGSWDFRYADEYRITNLPAGEYWVVGSISAKEGDNQNLAAEKKHKVVLRDGEETELDFAF